MLAGAMSVTYAASTNYTPAQEEVLKELSKRSGLPESDLQAILSDCQADQQSMYFCAYRDLVAADIELKHAVIEKEKAFPSCKSSIDAKIAKWERARDLGCEKSANKQYGEGSLKPTAEAMCSTFETEKMTKRIQNMQRCDPH
jgi:uncharacterized protein YecT (DUF1311 family)